MKPRLIKAVIRDRDDEVQDEKTSEFDASATDSEITEKIQMWAMQSQIHKIGSFSYSMWVKRSQEADHGH